HGDVQLVVPVQHVPRAVEARFQRRPALETAGAVLLPCAGDRFDRLLLQVESPNTVVLAVGDVEGFAVQRHALRVAKLGLGERSVGLSLGSRAGNGDLLALQVRNDDTVVRAVGDEQTFARGVGQHLAGEEQRAVALLAEARQLEAQRLLVERLLLAVNFDKFVYRLVQNVVTPFAGGVGDDLALGVDDEQGRPGVDLEAAPDDRVGVVDDRVADLVTKDRLADALGVAFVLELGRVHADDHQDVAVLLFELGQVRQRVDTVDAAQRPEVEDDDAAAQVFQADRPGGVQPGDATLEAGELLLVFLVLRPVRGFPGL